MTPETLLRLQRSAGNRAVLKHRALSRTLTHGTSGKAISPLQVGVIEEALRAYPNVAFPEDAWKAAIAKGVKQDLGEWLTANGYTELKAAKLIADARERLKAAAPPPHTLSSMDPTSYIDASHYGSHDTLIAPELIREESLDPEDWPIVSPAAEDVARPIWDEDAFLGAFTAHVKSLREGYLSEVEKVGDERDFEIETTSVSERRLMDLAWVLDKLKPERTCVAVTWTGTSVRLYANAIDDELVADAKLVMVARDEIKDKTDVTPTQEQTPVLLGLMDRILGSTRPRLSTGKSEPKEKYDARAEKAFRRIVKASEELARLQGGGTGLQIQAHTAHQVGKHAEMRLLDAITGSTEGSVSISKICCAKCFAAIRAAAAADHADLHVQGAHFATYESELGWPVPHFLKEKPAAMNAFLGDQAYAWYSFFPTEALKAIERKSLDVKRVIRTDPYSSDEDKPKKKKVKKDKKEEKE